MKVYVRGKQLDIDETLRCHIERRLEFSLGRFSPRILRATVQLTDVNGPSGGDDKVCRIEVRMRTTGSVFVEDRDADLVAVVDRAAQRIGRSVARAIERERGVVRRGRPGRTAPPRPVRSEAEDYTAE